MNVNDNDKIMGILSYLSILVLIPIFAAKDSKFARYHANQGATLAAIEIALGVVQIVVGFVLGLLGIGILKVAFNLLVWLVEVALLVLSILGIVNACQGEMKEVPVVGKLNWNLADKISK